MAEENNTTPSANKQSIEQKLDSQFVSENLSSISYKGVQEKYFGSEKQEEIYDYSLIKDSEFKSYIEEKYGSYETYKQEFIKKSDTFNPFTDYEVEVSIIDKNNIIYSTDNISSNEVIAQLLTGICTFYYLKINGTSGKSAGSLKAEYIPDSQVDYRVNFFSPMKGDRIVLWDVYKQKWNSFYMSRLIKMVRDETSDLQ